MTGWIDKAKDFIKGHPEQAKDALEKAEDLINERTGGKYAEHVDQGSDALGEQLGLPPDVEDAAAPEPGPGPEVPADPGTDTGLPRDSTSSGPAPVPSESPTPTPTPTDAGPTGSDTGTGAGEGPVGGGVPDPPSEGDITLGDPPPSTTP
ncbi:antitoxin [Intrasporangium sp. DVR]|uniref:antitoxin n=1 Tax=Intrasporangium sp. DVR TaxID=3127867 RepID=UPI00313A616E